MGFFDKVKKAFGSSKNFKYLDDLIHSGVKEIVLDSDIVLERGEKSEYLEGIKLDVDDLVIDGNGHTIDAKGKTRIFYCTGKNITIKNITLKKGYAKNGGSIYNDGGELTITKSTLTGNTAHGTEFPDGGAAVYNRGELTITESTLTENTAQERSGGAIHNWGELTITKSTLTENTSDWEGGAINNERELTIIESTLTGNISRSGGAIYNHGNLTITKSTLTGNTAHGLGWGGGAIMNYAGEVTITSSTFTGNTAQNEGGAIMNYEGEVTITESTITGNTAKEGGAIENVTGILWITNCKILNNKSRKSIINNLNFIEVHNTKFNNNQSKFVFSNFYEKFNISIIGCEFIDNNVEEAVIINGGKSCTIQKTIFENNLSRTIINRTDLTLISPKIKDEGQCILNDGHILIRQSQNLESKIYGEGTVETDEIPEEAFDFGYLDKKIHESNTKEIILDHDITFENYEIDYYEGGIELDMDDLVIDGNGHTIDGTNKSRIFIVTGKNITLKNITFKNGCSCENYHYHFNASGGAIRINYNAKITVEHCRFISNTAENDSGAIHNSGECNITKSSIQNNTSQDNGGAIINWGKLSITETLFKGNSTQEKNGGAINIQNGDVKIINCQFQENTAQGETSRGGAIYHIGNDNKLTITESTFTGNTAQRSGGAIYNDKSSELVITESTFTGNATQAVGGGGGAIDSDGELTISYSTLSGNTAKDGGGAIDSDGELTISNCTLTRNTSQRFGGSIYNGGVLTIFDSTLTGNASKNGGAIYHIGNGSKLTITGSTFNENTSHENGGAINNWYSELTIKGSTFKGNTTNTNGGAISNFGECSIIGSRFENNTSEDSGGAIYNEYGGLTISDSALIGNTSQKWYGDGGGGAIGIWTGEVTIYNSILTGNTAQGEDGRGGAIYNRGELAITESTLTGNTAKYGGAIYLYKSKKYESENCTFKDNKPDDVYEEK